MFQKIVHWPQTWLRWGFNWERHLQFYTVWQTRDRQWPAWSTEYDPQKHDDCGDLAIFTLWKSIMTCQLTRAAWRLQRTPGAWQHLAHCSCLRPPWARSSAPPSPSPAGSMDWGRCEQSGNRWGAAEAACDCLRPAGEGRQRLVTSAIQSGSSGSTVAHQRKNLQVSLWVAGPNVPKYRPVTFWNPACSGTCTVPSHP